MEAGKQRLVDVGGWWFCSYCLVLLFFLSWFIVFFDSIHHESPGTHRNMPCKFFFFDQTCFVDSSENLNLWKGLSKKHLAVAIFEDMYQRFWDASTSIPRNPITRFGRNISLYVKLDLYLSHSKTLYEQCLYLESWPAWLPSMQIYANIEQPWTLTWIPEMAMFERKYLYTSFRETLIFKNVWYPAWISLVYLYPTHGHGHFAPLSLSFWTKSNSLTQCGYEVDASAAVENWLLPNDRHHHTSFCSYYT